MTLPSYQESRGYPPDFNGSWTSQAVDSLKDRQPDTAVAYALLALHDLLLAEFQARYEEQA